MPDALQRVAEARTEALAAWTEAWGRVQRSSLERETRAVLLAESRRLEAGLTAYLAEVHAEVEGHLAAAERCREHGAGVVAASHEHAVEMALHHAHALIADVRDGFLEVLRGGDGRL